MTEREIVTDATYGAERILVYLEEIEGRIEGAIEGSDTEYVHKIRTNSRRLRTALSIFGDVFQGTDIGINNIKKMMKGLGKARDLDVRIIKIDNWLTNIEDPQLLKTLETLKELYIERREIEQVKVKSSLNRALESGFLKETMTFSNEMMNSRADHEPYSVSLYTRALREIHNRIDEVNRLSVRVEDENAFEEHHSMRIAVKHLRYSLSLLSGIYSGGFGDEIMALTSLQDAAGEMHDFDVWIKEVRKILRKIEKGRETSFKDPMGGLVVFLDFMTEKRKEEYLDFIEAWNRIEEEDILADIIRTCRTTHELNRDPGRIAVISDVHGNEHALNAVMEDARARGATGFLNAGDMVGYGAYPEETARICTGEGFHSIKGNLERDVLENSSGSGGLKGIALKHVRENLSEEMLQRLEDLPDRLMLKVKGWDFLLVHGSPDSMDEHLRSETPLERFKNISVEHPFDVIIFGHTHEQFSRKAGRTLFLNPGSVGRTNEGTTKAQYAMIGTDPFSFEMINIDYDVRSAVMAIREKGLPEEFARMILLGKGRKEIEGFQPEKPDQKRVLEFSRRFYWNTDHPLQVQKLSLMLFDELKDLHGLGEDERWLLACGSLLHDIGWSMPDVPHHKASMELILNDTELRLSVRDAYMIGSIARYHRKSLPSEDHFNYRRLNERDRKTLEMLASLVRIADGLDCSHGSIVRDLKAFTGEDEVTVRCIVSEGPFWEGEKVRDKKKDLFEKVFDKEVILQWERI